MSRGCLSWQLLAAAALTTCAPLNGLTQTERPGLKREEAAVCRWVPLGPAWVPRGEGYDGTRVPVSGRVTGIALDAAAPGTVYLGTALGGVWKSEDAGERWTPLTDDAPSLAIGALLAHPRHRGLVLAGTGEANLAFRHEYIRGDRPMAGDRGIGVLRTTDGGRSWQAVGQEWFDGASFAQFAARAQDDLVLAATTRGPFRSTDLGRTWSPLVISVPSIAEVAATSVAFHPDDVDVAYVALWGRGVFRSTNIRAPAPVWEQLTGGLPLSNLSRIGLAVTPAVPDALYALIADANSNMRGLFASHDRGLEWITVPATPDVLGGQGFFNLMVAADPVRRGVIFVGGAGDRRTHLSSLFRSDPSPAGWGFVPLGGEMHIDFHAIAFDPARPERVYVGNDGGIWRSDDGGDSWRSLNRGLNTLQFFGIDQHPITTALVVGGTQDNGTLVYRGGPAWSHADDGDGGKVGFDPDEPLTVYNTFFRYLIARSLTGPVYGGFSPIYPLDRNVRSVFLAPFALSPDQPRRIALGLHRVYLGMADGSRWRPISPDLTHGSDRFHSNAVSALAFTRAGVIYAGTSDGRVWRLDRLGAEWESVELTAAADADSLTGRYITDVVPLPGQKEGLLVALDADSVPALWHVSYEKGDSGAAGEVAWMPLGRQGSTALPTGPVFSVEPDPKVPGTIYAATSTGVHRSTDGGASWAPFDLGLPRTPVFDVQLHARARLLRAATHGRGVWEREVSGAHCHPVELYVRDHPFDQGRDGQMTVAVPDGEQWDSPDVKVVPATGQMDSIGYAEFEELRHEKVRAGARHRIHVQVANRGWQPSAELMVRVYVASGPIPPQLPRAPPSAPGEWRLVGEVQLKGISHSNPAVGTVEWDVPHGGEGAQTLLITLASAEGPFLPSADSWNPIVAASKSRHITLERIFVERGSQ